MTHTCDAFAWLRREHFLMMLIEKVVLHLDVFIHWRHDVSNFKSDSAYFDQILLHETVARNFKLRTPSLANDPPYFFFWLLFEYCINIIVYIVLVVDPVATVLLQQAADYLLLLLFFEHLLRWFEAFRFNMFYIYLRLCSVQSVTPFYFELLSFDFRSLEIV